MQQLIPRGTRLDLCKWYLEKIPTTLPLIIILQIMVAHRHTRIYALTLDELLNMHLLN